jgi:hypothetical protein
MNNRQIGSLLAVALGLTTNDAAAAPTTFTGIGGNNTSITAGTANAAMSAFLAAIGGANNGSGAGPFTNGFRTINWDGVADADATPNLLPANHFNSTSPRGVMLLTPGTGVAVSASTASGLPLRFGDINAGYTSNFGVFSPQRLFAPIDSNLVQVYFYQPGTNLPATVRGFGAIFNDVKLTNTTSMRCFGIDGADLGTFFVPVGSSGQSEFLGLLFATTDPLIGHVVVTLGTNALGASTNESASIDLVVMDDISYAEPLADLIFADGFD